MSEATKQDKPWMKQPGDLHDTNGVPVYPGDLLKSYHFTGRRNKRYFLYHTAVYRDGAMYMVPTCHLEPTKLSGGGSCMLTQELLLESEIIAGHGPGDMHYEDRAKVADAMLSAREKGTT
jgi:hypothetical protein